MEKIYLDNAATTPMTKEVIQEIVKTAENNFGNASAVNYYGRLAKESLDNSRHILAKSIHASMDSEIILTSGGTESDNTAIIETAIARRNQGRHLITTEIEHEAVLKPMKYLETLGYEVTYLPVSKDGVIDIKDLKNSIREDTILVSIMMGNNEIGSVQPIKKIGEFLSKTNAWFHTDCVQAYGLVDINVNELKIDLLSTSAHKLNGPKMLGFLYQRSGIKFPPLIKGGDQELKRRAGTENIPEVAGFAKAVEIAQKNKVQNVKKYMLFKNKILDNLKKHSIDFEVNGTVNQGELSHILSLWIKGISSDALLANLDLAGISISAGSACTAGSLNPSHVLLALDGNQNRANESIRISFGSITTEFQIDIFNNQLIKIIERMRQKNGIR